MNNGLEQRLSSLLDSEAERLPPPSNDVGSVMARAQQRRNRARLVGAGSLLAIVVAIAGLGGGLLANLRSEPTETVAANPGQEAAVDDDTSSIRTTMPQLPIMTIEPFPDEPDEPEEPTTTTAPPDTTTTTVPPETTTTTGAPDTTVTSPPAPPEGRRSTDDVIGNLADDEILFFSNGDDCRGIDEGQAHPDWTEGQPGSGRNSDGTPTYGFAYNTGDSLRGEIGWGFEEQSFALSGECVLQMGVADAYNEKRAIRIFRRYDQDGRDLPSDGYYSVWFYFPEEVSYDDKATVEGQTAYGFWNVFQIKNKIRGLDGSNQTFSALSFNAGKVTGDDHMSFHLWSKVVCGRVEECEAAGPIDQIAEPRPIPVGEWVHVELRLLSRSDQSGRIEMWQDGVKIYDYTGMTERSGADRLNWSVNNYGHLHRPATHSLYADDALISTRPVHPLLFD